MRLRCAYKLSGAPKLAKPIKLDSLVVVLRGPLYYYVKVK